ncbi:hypothetical protein ABBQ32_012747 [Trebouxia sp. C0010 RCD-2024]
MQARQQAGVTQAEVSLAAGQAAAAWAQVEAMESKGDAAGAAASAAEAVALQQQAQQCQAAADAAAVQAHRQEQAAAQSLTAAQTAAQLAGTNPKLLQQLSSELQIQPSDTNAISDDADTVRHMSALAEQLPWQLRQQSTEQLLPDSTDEQGGAEDTATSIQAEPQLITDFSRAARALEVGSFAEQQQQQLQQQVPGFVSMTDATRSSRAMDDVGMSQDGRGEEEAAAKAAYRQWSESFEARAEQRAQEARAPQPAAAQEASWSASSSVTPAVISWDSFKSHAKPGDKLRLVGNHALPSGDANNAMSLGVVTPAASGMPFVMHADVAEWAADVSSAALQTHDQAQLDETGDMPAEDVVRMEDSVAASDQMQWHQRLEAAGSQAEKLLVLAEVIR